MTKIDTQSTIENQENSDFFFISKMEINMSELLLIKFFSLDQNQTM